MSLRTRLTLQAAIACVMLVVVAVLGIFYLRHNAEDAFEYIQEVSVVHEELHDLYGVGLEMGHALRNVLLNPSDEKGAQNYSEAMGETSELIASLRQRA